MKGASPMLLLGDFTDMAPFMHHAPYQSGTGEHGNHDLRNLLASATKYTAAVFEPQHTDEILGGVLGYDAAKLAALRAAKAIA